MPLLKNVFEFVYHNQKEFFFDEIALGNEFVQQRDALSGESTQRQNAVSKLTWRRIASGELPSANIPVPEILYCHIDIQLWRLIIVWQKIFETRYKTNAEERDNYFEIKFVYLES